MPTPVLPRRQFLAWSGLGAVAAAFGRSPAAVVEPMPTAFSDHSVAPAVLAFRPVQVPHFPSRERNLGGGPGLGTNARPLVQGAIDALAVEGGGKLILGGGDWRLDGPLHLCSNLHLHLAEGAVLHFSPDPALYLPLVLGRWEGTEVFNYSPMLYAYQAVHVAITGPGRITGRAETTFATWRERQRDAQMRLREQGAAGVPVHERVYGPGHWLRPPLLHFVGCGHVLLTDFTIDDSPFWVVHLAGCAHCTCQRLTIHCPRINNDGIDLESCSDVLVEDCDIRCGDDAIALKAGRDRDGWRLARPTERVQVRRCHLEAPTAGSGIGLGSEMSGGIRQVLFEDCQLGPCQTALNMKANLDRGGTIEDIVLRRLQVAQADWFIRFTTDYHGYRGGQHPPRFRRFLLEDITCAEAQRPLHLVGVPSAPLEQITLRRVRCDRAAEPIKVAEVQQLVFEDVRVNRQLVEVP